MCLFETSYGKGLQALGFLRFFLSLYLAVFLIGIKIFRIRDLKLILSYKYLKKFIGDILIILTMFINLILENGYLNWSTKELLSQSKFIDIMEKSVIFNNIMILDSILLLLLSSKIISIWTILDSVRILLKIVSLSIISIFSYVIVLMPIILSLSVIGVCVYGPYTDYYRTLTESYMSVLFLLFGQWNVSELLKISSFWTIFYVLFTILISVILINGSFFCAIVYSFTSVTHNNGYPDEDKDKWTVKESILWIIDFLPNKILQKFKLYNKEIHEEESKSLENSQSDSKYSHDNINPND